ncbi:hypothetical protein D9M71_647270 [compost metagenome]
MFTAKDMANLINETNECANIDCWIENSLSAQFTANPKAFVATSILRVNKWTQKGFTDAMNKRGFSVEYVSDQRDGDFYTITYPPQEIG